MIEGFERETAPLTDDEMRLLPIIIAGLKTKVGKDMAIHGATICEKVSEKFGKLTEPRLRKIVNHIRTNGMLPVIATSKGYYISHDRDEINAQIQSLEQRRESINQAIQGLARWIE